MLTFKSFQSLRSATRSIVLLAVIGFAAKANAQLSQDPKAVNLTSRLIVLDTLQIPNTYYEPWNIGDQNGDHIDDLLFYGLYNDTISHQRYKRVLLGEHGLLDSSMTSLTNPNMVADINGDGLKDIITFEDAGVERRYVVQLGTPTGFGEKRALFINKDGLQRPLLIDDLDGDSFAELITTSYDRNTIYVYKGTSQLSFSTISDSAQLGLDFHGYILSTNKAVTGFFGQKSLLIGSSKSGEEPWSWILDVHSIDLLGSSFRSDSARLIYSDTILDKPLFIYQAPILTCDVTGDGLDDLLVGDDDHIYITFGVESTTFGDRINSSRLADATIPLPWLVDTIWNKLNIAGTNITFAGDITGSGVPFLAVSALMDTIGKTFLYACGKSIDSKYDAWLDVFTRTLSVRMNNQTALVMNRTIRDTSAVVLLHEGTESIPQGSSGVARPLPGRGGLLIRQSSDNTIEVLTPQGVGEFSQLRVVDILGRDVGHTTQKLADRIIIRLGGIMQGTLFVSLSDEESSISGSVIMLN